MHLISARSLVRIQLGPFLRDDIEVVFPFLGLDVLILGSPRR